MMHCMEKLCRSDWFEVKMANLLRTQDINAVCQSITRFACSDFENFLRVKWGVFDEEMFRKRFDEATESPEFLLLMKSWMAEWSHQWNRRVRIVNDPKDVPKKEKLDAAPFRVPKEALKDIMEAATIAAVNNKLWCGIDPIVKSVVDDKTATLKTRRNEMNEVAWTLLLANEVCREVRNLSKISGPLVWVILPKQQSPNSN